MLIEAADATENVSKKIGSFSDRATKHNLLHIKESASKIIEVSNESMTDRSAKKLLLGATATVAKRINAISDKSTKIRLVKVRARRTNAMPNPEETGYDNNLLTRLQPVYPFERIRQANYIGWRYWMHGRDSNQRTNAQLFASVDLGSTQFWSAMRPANHSAYVPQTQNAYKPHPYDQMMGIELESTFMAGSQRTKAVGDYVLRNQPEPAQWAHANNDYDYGYGYGADEPLPTDRRIEMK